MKNLKSLLIVIILASFIGCSSEEESDVIESANKFVQLDLRSPNGETLAPDNEALFELLKTSSKNEITSIEIEDIRYFEDSSFSAAAIDYYENDNFKSLLQFIRLDKDLMILKDRKGVQIVSVSGINNTTKKNTLNHTILNYATKADTDIGIGGGVGSAKCQGSSCCKWKQTGPNNFNCGCEEAVGVIITTSDGCEVEL